MHRMPLRKKPLERTKLNRHDAHHKSKYRCIFSLKGLREITTIFAGVRVHYTRIQQYVNINNLFSITYMLHDTCDYD